MLDNLDNTRALERIAAALEDISRGLPGGKPAGAEPVGGVPILLIVEVLIALIRVIRDWKCTKAEKEILTRQLARLESVLPGKEAEK